MELVEIRQELEKMAKRLAAFRVSLTSTKEKQIAELEEKMMGAGFWDDQQGAQAVINEANALKDMVGKFRQLDETFENLEIRMSF